MKEKFITFKYFIYERKREEKFRKLCIHNHIFINYQAIYQDTIYLINLFLQHVIKF